jgi:hypothetical protein
MGTKNANFRVDGDLWDTFQEYARSKGCSASFLLNQYIRECLDQEAASEKLEALEDEIASLTKRLEAIETGKKQFPSIAA